MKIRIKGNTVRYRLAKPEVEALAKGGRLEERTEFVSHMLQYAIQQTEDGSLRADYIRNTITLYVPQVMLQRWAATDQVSMDSCMQLPNGNTLYILLEKDFKCIDAPVTEDQSDYFDNPHSTC